MHALRLSKRVFSQPLAWHTRTNEKNVSTLARILNGRSSRDLMGLLATTFAGSIYWISNKTLDSNQDKSCIQCDATVPGDEPSSQRNSYENQQTYTAKPGFCNAVSFPYAPVYHTQNGRPLHLKRVVSITRHGDRSPIAKHVGQYGHDAERLTTEWQRVMTLPETASRVGKWSPIRPNVDSLDKENGPNGQLTELGIEQLEQIGQYFRTVYASNKYYSKPLLPAQCDSNLIFARSTNYTRCRQSLQSFLLGLYPPSTRGAPISEDSIQDRGDSVPGIVESVRDELNTNTSKSKSDSSTTTDRCIMTPIQVRAGHTKFDSGPNVTFEEVENLYPSSCGKCAALAGVMQQSRRALHTQVQQAVEMAHNGKFDMALEVPSSVADAGAHLSLKEWQKCLRCRQSAQLFSDAFGLQEDKTPKTAFLEGRVPGALHVPWIRTRDILLAHYTHQVGTGLPAAGFEMFPIAAGCAEVEMSALFRVPHDQSVSPYQVGPYTATFVPKVDTPQAKTLRLGMGLFVHELLRTFQSGIQNDESFRLKAFAAHDSSLVPLLAMFGQFSGKWPPYASTIVFELFSTQTESQSIKDNYYIRILYNGEPLALGTYQKMGDTQIQKTSVIPYRLFEQLLTPFEVSSIQEMREECSNQSM